MTSRSFTGQVSASGKLKLDAPILFAAACLKLKGKRVTVTVENEKARRSTAQNARLFAMLDIVTDAVNRKYEAAGSETRLTKDDVHEIVDEQFLGHEDTPLGPKRKHCSKLSVSEFTAHMDEVERFFRTEWGLEFPSPGFDVEEAWGVSPKGEEVES